MQHVLVTFGTRPEAIKMAPVVAALRARPDRFTVRVCVTAQHRGLLDQVLDLFDLRPDVDLDLMRPGQTPAEVTSRVVERMTETLASAPTDVVLVHGDTTTAMATTLAAFYLQIPVGHVEAGLRSGRMDAPFPEEMNRVVIDRMASHLYAPTPAAAENLRGEGVAPEAVLVTGNTAIDALLDVRSRLEDLPLPLRDRLGEPHEVVLITAHRRESFGAPLARIFDALDTLAREHPHLPFVYPVHPNPNVLGPANERLQAPNVHRVPPVGYAELVWLLDRSVLVLTDSGGIQEEGATLGKPLLVLREVTERPELITAGAGRLVGSDPQKILGEARRLLGDEEARAAMGHPRRLFGDGEAGRRIAADLAGDAPAPWEPRA
ncbi:MAG: non-hydrolyzing UDP-N-acetylglucosamine 2-epimerase [Planctomycetota bacterium]